MGGGSIAAITLTIAAFSTFGAIQTLFKEKSAPGRVVNLAVRTSRDSSTQVVTEITYPVVEFAPSGQPPLKVQMMEGSSSPDYALGDQVTVLYNPQQPRDARIKSFRKVTQANAMPAQDPELWRAHGMELLGPPLATE